MSTRHIHAADVEESESSLATIGNDDAVGVNTEDVEENGERNEWWMQGDGEREESAAGQMDVGNFCTRTAHSLQMDSIFAVESSSFICMLIFTLFHVLF